MGVECLLQVICAVPYFLKNRKYANTGVRNIENYYDKSYSVCNIT